MIHRDQPTGTILEKLRKIAIAITAFERNKSRDIKM